ncbi:hypothetical protein [Flagellimonas sp. CMM7]|uniref:hypothetical protein n=1 Tax=Flagellimonas sp. CMM7 TaxID=2654676 RepID=UPI0013D306A5|nr:hypothetical protein [Flagellimonas sp. CMM7]UII80210.1 hypothetical protein LV704_01535 [Flagellimonas sp. CMM7]
MIRNITYLFSFLWASFTFSQNDSIPIPIDENSVIQERRIYENLKEKYPGEEFNYDTNTGESKNLLARFLKWLFQGIGDAVGIDIPYNVLQILEYVIYGLMGLLVIYLLVRIFINEKFNSIFSKKAKAIIDIDLSEQHIEIIDLDALMNAALKNKDYRLAVRYQYLKILKLLSQKEIIEWHFDKTNADYEQEISGSKLKKDFKKVSYLYEYIWYGEQIINETDYTNASFRFTQLNNSISQ